MWGLFCIPREDLSHHVLYLNCLFECLLPFVSFKLYSPVFKTIVTVRLLQDISEYEPHLMYDHTHPQLHVWATFT